MCAPVVGILSAASSAVGAIGGYQSAQAQADYQNESAIRNYKHALMVREAKWYNTLANWNNQRTDYKKSLTENNLAAGRSYQSEQGRMNEMYQQAAFTNQDMLVKLLQASGLAQSSGQTGQSAQRQQAMQLAAYGRNNAVIAENLASAKNAMKLRNENTWYQHKGANNQAWNKVALAPVQDIAPPVPVMAPGPSGLGLAAGLLGAAASGIGAFNSLKAPAGFTDPFKSGTTGLGKTDWGSFNTNYFKGGFGTGTSSFTRPWSTGTNPLANMNILAPFSYGG